MNQHMQHALALAARAAEQGEVPVGAVIVDAVTGNVLAASHNCCEAKLNPLLHAEMVVIEQACLTRGSKTLDRCHLYATLEPCLMCATAIAYARIERVYYGAADEKFGAIEHGPRIFYSKTTTSLHKPEIYSGIMAEESKALLQNFFRKLRS